MTEYWAYRYFEDPKLANEIEDEDFDEEEIMAQWDGAGASEIADTVTPPQLSDPDDWETL